LFEADRETFEERVVFGLKKWLTPMCEGGQKDEKKWNLMEGISCEP
jgi:hypothetical protein